MSSTTSSDYADAGDELAHNSNDYDYPERVSVTDPATRAQLDLTQQFEEGFCAWCGGSSQAIDCCCWLLSSASIWLNRRRSAC